MSFFGIGLLVGGLPSQSGRLPDSTGTGLLSLWIENFLMPHCIKCVSIVSLLPFSDRSHSNTILYLFHVAASCLLYFCGATEGSCGATPI